MYIDIYVYKYIYIYIYSYYRTLYKEGQEKEEGKERGSQEALLCLGSRQSNRKEREGPLLRSGVGSSGKKFGVRGVTAYPAL